MSSTKPPASPAEQIVQPRGARKTMLDMARSMGLMLAVIFVLLVVTSARKLIFPSSDNSQAPITATEQLAEWHQLTGRPAVLPVVPGGWHINAATMSGDARPHAHLHVGWVTGQQYFGLDQSLLPASRLTRLVLGPGSAVTGTATVGGEPWTTYRDSHGDTVLERTRSGVTVLVVSTLPAAEVDRVTATLRQAPSSSSS